MTAPDATATAIEAGVAEISKKPVTRPLGWRPQDGATFSAFAAVAAGGILAARGRSRTAAVAFGTAALAAAYAWKRSRAEPRPMPFSLRWTLQLPRGRHSARNLLRLLEPRPGERILEIGAGIGVHTLEVAKAMSGGLLTAVDLQEQMRDELVRRAEQAGVGGIEAIAGDAQHLPLANDSFDAAYLISVLGEVPDRNAALAEVARVLKGGGRLIIGEFALDPDFVPLGELRAAAAAAGFEMERIRGWRLSYLAEFRLR